MTGAQHGPESLRVPGDVPTAVTVPGLAQVFDAQHEHRDAHRTGRRRLTDGQAVDVALCELALSAALVDRLLAGRWSAVADALAWGARETDVAAACGLDVDELRAGLSVHGPKADSAPGPADDALRALLGDGRGQ